LNDWINGKEYPTEIELDLLADYFKVRKNDLTKYDYDLLVNNINESYQQKTVLSTIEHGIDKEMATRVEKLLKLNKENLTKLDERIDELLKLQKIRKEK